MPSLSSTCISRPCTILLHYHSSRRLIVVGAHKDGPAERKSFLKKCINRS